MDLIEYTFKNISLNRLTQHGQTVLVGVSGGPDSAALLDVLWRLRYKLGLNIHVAHFNHRLRPQADRDEDFVRVLAQKLGLPFHGHRRQRFLKAHTVSEETARRWRLNFFLKVVNKIKADAVVLAHTKNDLAETVLMRFLRGAGLSGLRGVLSEHHMGQLKLIRPFLSVSRMQIEEYIKINAIKYCTDETNQQKYYLRNKIRLDLLPLLVKEYNPNFPQVLVDLAHNCQADYDYIFNQAAGLFKMHAIVSSAKVGFQLKFFLKQDLSMRRMLLRLAFDRLTGSLNQLGFSHIQELEDMILNRPVGSSVHWPKAIAVSKTKTNLVLKRLKLL